MVDYKREDLEEKTNAELREICRQYNIVGMSKARKDDLVDAIMAYQEDAEDAEDAYNTDHEEIDYINANLTSYKKKNNVFETLVTVSCGAASSNYPVVGKSVGYVKALYREILNIETDSSSIVNGEAAEDSYVLKNGDVLEFVREAGRKG